MTPSEYPVILDELALLGMDLARALHAEGMAGHDALPTVAAAFDRVARAVRRTVLVAQRVRQTTPAPQAEQDQAARRQIIRAVEDAIDAPHPTPQRPTPADPAGRQDPDPAALRAEFYERIDRPEFDHDLATRPVPELIAEIVRDLALAVPGATPRRTPADIAVLHARAARRLPPPAVHLGPRNGMLRASPLAHRTGAPPPCPAIPSAIPPVTPPVTPHASPPPSPS